MVTTHTSPTQRPSTSPHHAGLLRATPILNFEHPSIQQLIEARGWRALGTHDAVGAAYDFVRDEIAFGYNATDDLPAADVLAEGIGQCNTKGTLLMALLRALGVPCRLHGFTIDKALQRGAITGVAYALAPAEILHSWVEVWTGDAWVNLEGFILDVAYLDGLRAMFPEVRGAFSGYAVATPSLIAPPVFWCGQDTYIQREGIRQDLGLYDDPDAFYTEHGGNTSGLKQLLYASVIRHGMNRNVARVRAHAAR